MVVMVIAAILVGGVYTLFMTQQRSYSVQDQVTGVQQDARAALTFITRDIRMAGGLLGSGGFNVHGAQFAITPTNGGSGGTDTITVVYAADEFTSGGSSVTVTNISGVDVTLSADPSSFFDSGSDPDRFVAFEGDDTVYEISSINTAGANTLTLTTSPPVYLETVAARVFRAKAITYQVQNGVLQRAENGGTAQPMAGDGTTTVVEDLQFAYQVEGVGDCWTFDGQVTGATETNDAALPGGATNADIRMVRINITVRTAVEDATVADADPAARFDQPTIEDHTTGLNTDDGFRRRVYTTVVKARNL